MSNSLAVTILLDQMKDAHKNLEATMEGVTNEVAAFMPPGTANPIGSTYAHLIFSEDFFTHAFLQEKAPLMETEFKDQTGASEVQPSEWEVEYPRWLKEVKVDIPQMQKYAHATYAASEAYVASLNDEDLLREVDMSAFGMGTKTVGAFIAGLLNSHARDIMGEISVLKGIQGLKGYPF